MNKIDTIRRDRQALVDELTKAGARFEGNSCVCPFHEDKRPSAGIFCRADHWRFKCQACGAAGDVLDIRARNENRPLAEILVAARAEQQRPVSSRKSSQTMGSGKKSFRDLDVVRSWVQKHVGAVVSEHHYTDRTGERILQVVFRCQTADEHKTYRPCRLEDGCYYLGAAEKPRPLYNLPGIAEADTVILVEGEKCVDALGRYDIVATTSPAGAKNAQHADWEPLTGKNCILWPDHDEEGQTYVQAVERILAALEPPARVSIIDPVSLDLGPKEDVADFIEQLDTAGESDIAQALHAALARARPKGTAGHVLERIEDAIAGRVRGIPWPWPELSNLSRALRPGALVVLCGSPGASKSFLLLQTLAHWYLEGIKVAIYEIEETGGYHLQRALAQQARAADLTNLDWIEQNPMLARAACSEHKQFLDGFGACVVASPDALPTLDQLAQWIEKRAQAGTRIIAIDPITAAARKEKAYVSDPVFLRNIGRTAEDHGCSIILVTHPVKTVSGPDMSQIAGGAAYSRHAQCLLWLESHEGKRSKVRTCCGRNEAEHNRTLHILKARDGKGTGLRLAYQFSSESLTLGELGVIVKDK